MHADRDSRFNVPPTTWILLHLMSTYKTSTTLCHDHRLKYQAVIEAQPEVNPILRIENGQMHMHVAEGSIHLPPGQHPIPVGGYSGTDIDNTMIVHSASPLFKSRQTIDPMDANRSSMYL
jgi:hypothetical protein